MMVRKTITQLTGVDSEYSRQFVDDGPLPTPPVENTPQSVPESPPNDAPQAKSKSARKPKPSGKRTVPARVGTSKNEHGRKMVGVMVFPLEKHLPELERLATHGIATSDAIKIAGRRAVARFEPGSSFKESPEAERLPTAFAYRSNKTVDTSILEKLRAEADPLNLRGEGALIRGQVEPLFWEDLDAVILELKSRLPDEKG